MQPHARAPHHVDHRAEVPVHTGATGLTLVELLMVLVCTGMLLAMAVPKYYAISGRYRVNQATMIVATDLGQAVSLAARRQAPLTISLETGTGYVFKDRRTAPNDTVRLRRNLQLSNDLGARTVSFSPASVTVFPNGVVDQLLTVTLGSDGYTRQVTLSPAGQVRIVAAQ